ncbi:MAG: flagellar basal-body rod protein FlgF [Pelotomaculum sp.]|nr:flagellar basal-body rod protein FlgF [Pelotomaculum sp.]
MIRGLYSAAAGMDVLQAKVESVSNNLANASTPGYKREDITIRSFPEMLLIRQGGIQRKPAGTPEAIGTASNGVLLSELFIDHTQGDLRETGDPADVAIKGPAFFAVSAPGPESPDRVCYTRNGAFKIDQEGYLVTAGGYRVLGEDGEIRIEDFQLNDPARLSISPDGSVRIDGMEAGRLMLVEFDDVNSLQKVGEGLFEDPQGTGRPAVSSSVCQGYLEAPNVNVVDEMVSLITATRAYEANQRIIQSQDELLAKAVNQVGSLR